MNDIVNSIASTLGLTPATMAVLMIILLMAADKIAKAIPDDSTGWRRLVKLVARVIAVDISNKLTSAASIRDVATAVLDSPSVKAKLDVPDDGQGTLELTDKDRVKFPPRGLSVILMLILVMPLMSGCATVGTGIERACQNRDAALALVIALGSDKVSDHAIRVYRYVNAICPVLIDDINKGVIPGLTPVPLGVLPPPAPGHLG